MCSGLDSYFWSSPDTRRCRANTFLPSKLPKLPENLPENSEAIEAIEGVNAAADVAVAAARCRPLALHFGGAWCLRRPAAATGF